MTDHLPECPVDFRQVFSDCICDRLRACEQRVIAEGDEQSLIAYSSGYNNAFEACIAAIHAMPTIEDQMEYAYLDLTVPEILAVLKDILKDTQ